MDLYCIFETIFNVENFNKNNFSQCSYNMANIMTMGSYLLIYMHISK